VNSNLIHRHQLDWDNIITDYPLENIREYL